jgi:hypothetical protein
MLDLSIWRDEVLIRHQGPQFCNNKRAGPKKLAEVTIFGSHGTDRPSSLILDVLSYQYEITGHFGVDILVRFVSLLSMLRVKAMLRVGGVERERGMERG